jgi:predicted dehydrogenase
MLKAGVIGGNMELRAALVEATLPKDKVEVVAIVDRDPIMRDRYRAAHPGTTVKLLETYQELLALKEIDVVFIMVRDCYHEAMACAALEAGKAVYLEKPMAISIEGCDHILETAYRTRQKLFLGHNMRYMPFVQKLDIAARQAVAAGVLGHQSMRNGNQPYDVPPLNPAWIDYFDHGQRANLLSVAL